jgi:1-acyl-sn-glycerol-3-phosphate acyltransferase
MEIRIFYTIVRAVMNFIMFGLFKLHVEGRENVPKEGAIIVAPNHKSDWDPPLIGVAFNTRVIHYMAKAELFKNPVAGWVLRLFGTFPVHRGRVDQGAVKRALQELRKGEPLGIFPEGTRIRRDGLGRFHSGMASIAMISGAPIVPVAVLGSRDMPHKTGPLAVLIGKPIPVEKKRPDNESIKKINEQVREAIENLAADYRKRLGDTGGEAVR